MDPNLALVLRVIPALLVVLAASALCGRVALWCNQPRVLGEMVAGVLLGPTLLGSVWPTAEAALFTPQVKPVLYVLSSIGLTLFMFLVGAGFDHGRGLARHGTMLAVSGVVPSMVLGAGVGLLLYPQLSRPDVGRAEFALFIGGALAVTAFPMLASILYERGLHRSRLGRLSLMAASVDDVIAWCFLAVLSALHSGRGGVQALLTVVEVVAFGMVMLFVVPRLLRPLGRRVERTGTLGLGELHVVLGVVLLAGFTSDLIGVYSVFGGFLAGLAMPRTPAFREALHRQMMDVVCALLLPVFFAFSGLNTHLQGLAGAAMIGPFLLLLGAGFAGKLAGCALTLRATVFGWRESVAVGGLMNARGLMILIFINIGLAQGIISEPVFAMLVLVAVVTTAAALPIYRRALPARLEPAAPEAPPPETGQDPSPVDGEPIPAGANGT